MFRWSQSLGEIVTNKDLGWTILQIIGERRSQNIKCCITWHNDEWWCPLPLAFAVVPIVVVKWQCCNCLCCCCHCRCWGMAKKNILEELRYKGRKWCTLSLAKFTTIHNSLGVCVCQNRAFWRNCGIKGHGDVPFPSLKPRKFTTITPDSGYLLNRLQKPNNFQASWRKRQTYKQTNKQSSKQIFLWQI